jgi:undecaprenyl pyrophosphate synthase
MAPRNLPVELQGSPMPRHVAVNIFLSLHNQQPRLFWLLKDVKHLILLIQVVMDGNARWASERGASSLTGHSNGLEAFKNLVSTCLDWELQALTVKLYFSSVKNTGQVVLACSSKTYTK